MTTDSEEWESAVGAKLWYSKNPPNINHVKYLHIVADGLLENRDTTPYSADLLEMDGDIFSKIFFMLSRHEEYLPFEPDDHGRFTAGQSQAFKQGVLELPIVDMLIRNLGKKLLALFPSLPIAHPTYQFLPTFDIDHARAFGWKPVWRRLGGWMRDITQGRFDLISERWKTIQGKQKDPFDTFDYIRQVHRKKKVKIRMFWLLGQYGKYDKNPSPSLPEFKKLIRTQSEIHDAGIHPSYASHLNPSRVIHEARTLESSSGFPITHSRFHFLRFRLPESYQLLLETGMQEDYSMAFSDHIGFRAGTAHSFYWYDLKNEEETTLLIHPFPLMDVTLKNYMGLSHEAAIERSAQIIRQIRTYGGRCVLTWHNSSFHTRDWEGWQSVYEQLLELGTGKNG